MAVVCIILLISFLRLLVTLQKMYDAPSTRWQHGIPPEPKATPPPSGFDANRNRHSQARQTETRQCWANCADGVQAPPKPKAAPPPPPPPPPPPKRPVSVAQSHRGYPDPRTIAKDALESQASAAYKALIAQYHPDKVAHLGPELREVAAKKSLELNLAIKTIREFLGK